MYLQDVIDYFSEQMTDKEFRNCQDINFAQKIINQYFDYEKEFNDLVVLLKDHNEDVEKFYMLMSEPIEDLLEVQKNYLCSLKSYNHIFVKYLLTFC